MLPVTVAAQLTADPMELQDSNSVSTLPVHAYMEMNPTLDKL